MNFSMWMLYDKLRGYNPVQNIQCNDLRISSIRVMSVQEKPEEETDKLFVWLENIGGDPFAAKGTVQLLNGQDIITLPNVSDTSRALNDLLAAYSYFNSWETRLHRAVANKSVQQLLDLATEILDNPMVMADMQGVVLAMSSDYMGKDVNAAWAECRDMLRLPEAVIRAPMVQPESLLGDMTDIPSVKALDDGTQVLGAYFGKGKEYSGGIGVWNTEREFLPSDGALLRLVCDAASEILSVHDEDDALHSTPDILVDMLEGKAVDEVIVRMLETNFPGPRRLALLHNPYYTASQAAAMRSYLVTRLRSATLRNVATVYEGNVIAIVKQDDLQKLLDQVIGSDGEQYYIVCLSQPFNDLHLILPQYENVRFLLAEANEQPGVYYAENSGLQYIIHRSRAIQHRMVHPALAKLKAHDAEKNSSLYETLYQFLMNERSAQRTAQALHIHKNSLLYRLNQLRELVDIDLDDPTLRTYLIISYAIDKDNLKRITEKEGEKE